MRRSPHTWAGALLILTAALCHPPPAAGEDGPQPAGAVVLEARELEAAGGQTVQAQVGRLSVPEVRSDPESRTIRLAFVRLQSRAERPAAPLVYLAGGPGGSATWQAEEPGWLANWLPILEVCDVILLDQRGTGESRDSAACSAPVAGVRG